MKHKMMRFTKDIYSNYIEHQAGMNKSDTGDPSERVTPREPVEVTLGSPGQWSQLMLVHPGQWCQGR